jgi:hypothetical protein
MELPGRIAPVVPHLWIICRSAFGRRRIWDKTYAAARSAPRRWRNSSASAYRATVIAAVEYNGFKISMRQQEGRWIATIRKPDGSLLFVSLEGNTGSRLALDTQPPTCTQEGAIKLAKDLIRCGNVK